jgi:trehalose 6-phosphate phosphatase
MSVSEAPRGAGVVLAPPPIPRLAAASLFADLDGTLTPLVATPDAVGPDADRRRLLDGLTEALSGRLAVISGRSLVDLDRVLEGRVAAIAAVHGLVRRTAERVVLRPPEEGRVARAIEAFRAFAAGRPGLLVENKAVCATLHFRQAPELAQACRDLAARESAALGLVVQEGDMVVEVFPPGKDKGTAVEAFMTEPPFAGTQPIFVGDDLTDENGFRAARALGGFGVVVGARRPTRADYALPNVAAAKAWLEDVLRSAHDA